MMAAYLAYFGWFTIHAHHAFETHSSDLGYYDQILWNTIRGRPFRSTLVPGFDNSIADHFEPTLLLLAPVYALWQKPEMLLLLQTAALALGALPVYCLGRESLHRALAGGPPRDTDTFQRRSSLTRSADLLALGFAAAYLLSFPVHSANVFEFHTGAFAVPLLLYALFFLRTGRHWPFYLCILLTMGTKEVMPLTTFAVGFYAVLQKNHRVAGVVTMLVSALWFGLAVGVIIPHFSPQDQSRFFVKYYGWLGTSFQEILTRSVTHPEMIIQRLLRPDNLLALHELLRPLLYTPVFGLPVLLLAAPAQILNALSDWSFQHRATSVYHYSAAVIPFVIIAALDGMALLARGAGLLLERFRSPGRPPVRARLAAAATLVGLVLVATLAVQREQGYLPFSRLFYVPPQTDRVAAAEAIVNQVPSEGSVSADLNLGAHLTSRESIYLFPEDPHEADFLVVDVRYREGPFPPRDRYNSIMTLLDQRQYGVVDGRDGYLLLERGLTNPAIPASFYNLARAGQPSPAVRLDVEFGGLVRLLGYDVVWERPVDPSAYLVLYWQALQPVDQDLRLFSIQTDAMGELVPGTELELAETVWYPPSHWQPGEVICTVTIRWNTDPPRRFGIALGIVDGPGFWDIGQRLMPLVRAAPAPLALLHADSLLWVATFETKDHFLLVQPPGV